MHPFSAKVFADGDHQGAPFRKELANVLPDLAIAIVGGPDHATGFVALRHRWMVERSIAWLNRCRRLAKDWANLNRKALVFRPLASPRIDWPLASKAL
jgi:transposase